MEWFTNESVSLALPVNHIGRVVYNLRQNLGSFWWYAGGSNSHHLRGWRRRPATGDAGRSDFPGNAHSSGVGSSNAVFFVGSVVVRLVERRGSHQAVSTQVRLHQSLYPNQYPRYESRPWNSFTCRWSSWRAEGC